MQISPAYRKVSFLAVVSVELNDKCYKMISVTSHVFLINFVQKCVTYRNFPRKGIPIFTEFGLAIFPAGEMLTSNFTRLLYWETNCTNSRCLSCCWKESASLFGSHETDKWYMFVVLKLRWCAEQFLLVPGQKLCCLWSIVKSLFQTDTGPDANVDTCLLFVWLPIVSISFVWPVNFGWPYDTLGCVDEGWT